jgi:hypothetical protein
MSRLESSQCNTIAADLDGLNARVTRSGYNAKDVTELLGAKPREASALLGCQLAPQYAQELHENMHSGRHASVASCQAR